MKKQLLSLLGILVLSACGKQNIASPTYNSQNLSNKEAKFIASSWLSNNGAVIDNTSRAKLNQEVRALNSNNQYESETPYIKRNFTINSIKESNKDILIDLNVIEEKGISPESINEGGDYHYIMTISKYNDKYQVNEVAEETYPGNFVNYSQKLNTFNEKKSMIQEGFVKNKTIYTQRLSYNNQKARDYARTYAINANPQYDIRGNDCTNFISQALKAGGWEEVGGGLLGFVNRAKDNVWFYGDPWSYTWGGAANWSKFALPSGRVQKVSSINQLSLGDIVQVDYTHDGLADHSMVVTQTPSTANVYKLSYHTSNRLDATWDSVVSGFPNATFMFYKVNYSN